MSERKETNTDNSSKIFEDRKYISGLIYKVLTDEIPVRVAILNFPKNSSDPTVKTVYHALVHREADVDLRLRDIEYREEQDDYLEFLAETLQKGEPVPKNIIKEYEPYYKDVSMPYSDNTKNILKKLCKFLNV